MPERGEADQEEEEIAKARAKHVEVDNAWATPDYIASWLQNQNQRETRALLLVKFFFGRICESSENTADNSRK